MLSDVDVRKYRAQVKGLDPKDAVTLLIDKPGVRQSDIVRVLRLSRSSVSRIVGEIRVERQVIEETYANDEQTVTNEELAFFERFDPEGFRAFYNKFSGYEYPEHWHPWTEAFFRESNLILNTPPRHAKTTWVRWLCIYLICLDRGVQILVISETGRFAITSAQYVAATLENNVLLTSAYGEFRPDTKGTVTWSPGTGRLTVAGKERTVEGPNFTLLSLGTGQQTLGFGADVVILDDATNARITRSETDRHELMRYVREEAFSRFLNTERYGSGGKAVVIGQRVAFGDLYAELAATEYEDGDRKGDPLFHVEMYPAVLSWSKKKVLWDRLDWQYLMGQYARLGSSSFETLYQQNPVPEGGAIVKEDWLEQCRDRSRGVFEPRAYEEDVLLSRVLSVDPSPTQYTGLVLADIPYSKTPTDQRIDVLYSGRRRFSSADALIAHVKDMTYRYGCDYLIVEDSSVSKVLLEHPFFSELRGNGVRLIRHKTTINKNDIEVGVRNLGPLWEFSRISLPYSDADAQAGTTILEEEVRTYPNNRLSDVLMALWFVAFNKTRFIPRGGLPTTFDVTKLLDPSSKHSGKYRRLAEERVSKEFGKEFLETQRSPQWAAFHLMRKRERLLEEQRKKAVAAKELEPDATLDGFETIRRRRLVANA